MSEQVKINLNLSTGEVAIDAPISAIDSIFDRLESFLPTLASVVELENDTPEEGIADQENSSINSDETPKQKSKSKTKAKKTSTKGSSTKPETYKTVELGLSADKRAAFKEFYESKSPNNQSDQVLVVIYWLLKNTDKTKLTLDEIFTGLRTVGEKVPKRITSVLSNLSLSSYITKENSEPKLLHIGEDYVDHELPKKSKK